MPHLNGKACESLALEDPGLGVLRSRFEGRVHSPRGEIVASVSRVRASATVRRDCAVAHAGLGGDARRSARLNALQEEGRSVLGRSGQSLGRVGGARADDAAPAYADLSRRGQVAPRGRRGLAQRQAINTGQGRQALTRGAQGLQAGGQGDAARVAAEQGGRRPRDVQVDRREVFAVLGLSEVGGEVDHYAARLVAAASASSSRVASFADATADQYGAGMLPYRAHALAVLGSAPISLASFVGPPASMMICLWVRMVGYGR